MGDLLNPDFQDFIKCFNRHKVRYVLLGEKAGEILYSTQNLCPYTVAGTEQAPDILESCDYLEYDPYEKSALPVQLVSFETSCTCGIASGQTSLISA